MGTIEHGIFKDFKDKVMKLWLEIKCLLRKAQHFNVCIQTIQNWKSPLVTKPIPGRPAKISKEQILKDVEQYPDDYISERAERFGVSTHAVFNALHAAGISRKKTLKSTLKTESKINVGNFRT